MVAFQADKEKILKSATPWNVPSEHPDRLCGSDEAACARPGTLLCAKCRLNKYCSPACQKKVWPRHKKVCVRHFKRPVYDIVSYDPSDSDYFKTIGASPNRPNIAIIVKTFPDPIAAISDHLIHMSAEHNYRVGYFGAAKFPKTVIMLPDRQSCERMLKLIGGVLCQESYVDEGGGQRVAVRCHPGHHWREQTYEGFGGVATGRLDRPHIGRVASGPPGCECA